MNEKWTALAVMMLVPMACGGESDDDGGQAGSAGSGGSTATGGSSGGGSAVCPAQLPQGACDDEGRICEYGDDVRIACRDLVECKSGQWEAETNTNCPTTTPSDQCPADPNAPPDGICGATPNIYCVYGSAVACTCSAGGGAAPPDGGVTSYWACQQPPGNGCPDVAPNVGHACGLPDDQSCSYGPTCGSYLYQCKDGIWTRTGPMPCA